MEFVLLVALLPVILLLIYIYKKDTHTEPISLVRSVFLGGCVIIFPVLFIELIMEKFFPTTDVGLVELFINVFFGVALVEELFKWLVVKKKCYKNPEFDETYDAIVYSVAASLGFAAIENIIYVVGFGFGTGLFRAVTAVPGHAAFGVIMGYYFGKAKFNSIEKKDDQFYIVLSLIIPALLHTIYDFLLFSVQQFELLSDFILWVIFVIGLFIVAFININKVSNLDKELFGENKNKIEAKNGFIAIPKKCPNCGSSVNSRFCPICGRRHY